MFRNDDELSLVILRTYYAALYSSIELGVGEYLVAFFFAQEKHQLNC